MVACRSEATAEALRSRGVEATALTGQTVRARLEVVRRPKDLRELPALAVLATKCSQAAAALSAWAPRLPEECPVVAVQNGVLGDELAPLAEGRLMEATVGFPATLVAPGRSVQTGPGRIYLGPWPQASPRDDAKRYRAVAEILAAAAPVQASPNMRGVKWTKLLINSFISTVGAATGRNLGELLAEPRARAVFLDVVTEGRRAGLADGVRFEPVEGFRPGLFDRGRRFPGGAARRLLLAVVARRYRRQRSSSLQSLERGEPSEVDFLNGQIVRTARRHGLEAPVNQALVDTMHAIEAGALRPDVANLDRLRA